MADPRETDLILAPNEFVYIADNNTGLVKPIVGPTKKTLDSTEQPMIFKQGRFVRMGIPKDALQTFVIVDERSYCILENPAKEGDKEHPVKGQDNPMPVLLMGQKKNIPGPTTFALWPGQVATVLEGHQLRSNQYLRCVVHNAKEAMLNWNKAVVDAAKTDEGVAAAAPKKVDLVTGQILIIKGTEVSYYIPPTGINVVPEEGRAIDASHVRDAVTLERLEYCILKAETGEKRYVKGPSVVFPLPNEIFVEKDGTRKFRAIELNDNMGIYLKVIADYTEDNKSYKAGDELFVTGKQTRIYYPRAEHALIKYDEQYCHYAVAVPEGEARYVMDKDLGKVETRKGPVMLLPDPRKEIIIRRVLSDREVSLWFPGNAKAVEVNQTLRQATRGTSAAFGAAAYSNATPRMKAGALMDESLLAAAAGTFAGDDMTRQTTYTPPRTLTLDTKYEGAVNINVWPGYAVQIVNKNGKRTVVEGPQSVVLEYDQTLEVMELSTGKPKTDHNLISTVYLRVKGNRVSDLVEADTKDMVRVSFKVVYRVNFEGDSSLWFGTENYVKLLTQNCRSIIRNEIQKHGIEEVVQRATMIIRDVILGVSTEKKERPGHAFPENGMRVYDVEVLETNIGDDTIKEQLRKAQVATVQSTILVAQKRQELTAVKEIETCARGVQQEKAATRLSELENSAKEADATRVIETARREAIKLLTKLDSETAEISRLIKQKDAEQSNADIEKRTNISVDAFERKFKAIQPDLIAALEKSGETELARTFAEHIPQAGGGIGMVLGGRLLDNLLALTKGTSFEKVFSSQSVQDGVAQPPR